MGNKRHIFAPLNKSQVVGLVVLLLLLVLVISSMHIVPKVVSSAPETNTLVITSTAEQLTKNLEQARQYTPKKEEAIEIHLAPFDPNTADSITLLKLGLSKYVVRNILNYRRAGGKFLSKEKFSKIYGMNDSIYSRLEQYIIIPTDTTSRDTTRGVTTQYPIAEKLDTIIELNSADTTSLKLIRGIGSYTARKILHYRQQLGGYYRAEQVLEIKELAGRTDSLLQYLRADTSLIVPIKVNHSTVERLQRHPYISFTQAKEIYTLRRSKYRITNISQIEGLGCFSQDELLRLKPYLDFSD